MPPSLIQFEEAFFERIWGGRRLRDELGLDAPANRPIGEAWLICDHANHDSVVGSGPWQGKTLHNLIEECGDYLLGTHARPTIHGQFPLLLKLLDAADVLSVQVHPDDAAAAALHEPDVGKTEMWYVLRSEPDSTLICGLDPALTREQFLEAAENGTIQAHMPTFPAPAGTTAFVAAGTVHAIGGGILLAEIQQNSDLTYRIHDWDRRDAQGQGRELHLDKAARVTRFGSTHGGAAHPLAYSEAGQRITILGACRYFANALIALDGTCTRQTHRRSFRIIMATDKAVTLTSNGERCTLEPFRAALVPAGAGTYTLSGAGDVLEYFVPDLDTDIVRPLQGAGHDRAAIGRLGLDA